MIIGRLLFCCDDLQTGGIIFSHLAVSNDLHCSIGLVGDEHICLGGGEGEVAVSAPGAGIAAVAER